jgi:hypothetical protein
MILAMSGSFLMASLVWGSVGMGYFIYGVRGRDPWPLAGGVVIIVFSYLVDIWWVMSLVSIAAMALVYWLKKNMPV